MEGARVPEGPGPTGNVPGPGPGPRPKRGEIFGRIQERLKQLGIGGGARPGGSRMAKSSLSAPFSSSPSIGAPQVSESVELSQLGDMAARLNEGRRLTAKRGILQTAHRPRFFADLTMVSKSSPENARKFLTALTQASERATTLPEKQSAQKALELFTRSAWFKSVLRRSPDLGDDLFQAATTILGDYNENNQNAWSGIWSTLSNCGLQEKSTEVIRLADAAGLRDQAARLRDQATRLRDLKDQLLSSVAPCVSIFPPLGVQLRVGDQTYSVTPEQSGENTVLRFYVKKERGELEIGTVFVDPGTGQPSALDSEGRLVDSLPPDLQSCLEALRKLAPGFLSEADRLQKQRLQKTTQLLRAVAPCLSIFPPRGVQLSVGGQTYSARPELSEGNRVLRFYAEKDGGKREEIGSVFVDPVTGRQFALDGKRNRVDSLPPDLEACMEALSARVSEISLSEATRLKDQQKTAQLLRPVALCASIFPPWGMQLSVGNQAYSAISELSEGNRVLRFYAGKEGNDREEIGTVFVDPRTGQLSILDDRRNPVDSLPPDLQACMEAVSERVPEIIQVHLEPSVLVSQNANPELRRRGEKELLDFAASELFQELLKADEKVRPIFLDEARKILGDPSQGNEASWLAVRQSIQEGGTLPEETLVQKSLEPTSEVSAVREVTNYADLLPKRGLFVNVGERTYLAEPRELENGTKAIHWFAFEEGSPQGVGTVGMNSQTGAIVSILDAQEQPIDHLPPQLSDCMRALSEKLPMLQKMHARLIEEGVDPASAEKIIEQWAIEWNDCIAGEDPETGLMVQQREAPGSAEGQETGGIRGLKIRMEEAGLCGYYSFSPLGEGAYKRAKKMVHITPDGRVVPLVRYAARKAETEDEDPWDEFEEQFLEDVDREVDIRKSLEVEGRDLEGDLGNDHLYENVLWVYNLKSHIGKPDPATGKGAVKTRYIGEFADGGDLVAVAQAWEKAPPEQRKMAYARLVHGFVGGFQGLRQVHARGYVHRDIKPENILMLHGTGKLADFGLCVPKGDREIGGSFSFMAPEMFQEDWPGSDTSMDMYSFGTSLLALTAAAPIAPEDLRSLEIESPSQIQEKLRKANTKVANAYGQAQDALKEALDEQKKVIEGIQSALKKTGAQPWMLIADLIDHDPQKRPKASKETLEILQRYERSLLIGGQ